MITIKTQFFYDDEATIEIDNATSLLQYPSSMCIFEKSTRMICRNVFGMSSFFRLSAFYRHSLLRDDINLSHSLLNILKKKIIILPFALLCSSTWRRYVRKKFFIVINAKHMCEKMNFFISAVSTRRGWIFIWWHLSSSLSSVSYRSGKCLDIIMIFKTMEMVFYSTF